MQKEEKQKITDRAATKLGYYIEVRSGAELPSPTQAQREAFVLELQNRGQAQDVTEFYKNEDLGELEVEKILEIKLRRESRRSETS